MPPSSAYAAAVGVLLRGPYPTAWRQPCAELPVIANGR
eukprot:CAMPEP_0183479606 /NCGR_PEP_ID=MMETSP0370-20130417/171893_1 /TAXON_ID=268820 /ORGANISM="Peridinium aciculiferum, Strain PAER-2" /LENGTH=37 /DNA_ID= /DNA_START= /DNA_END= /DNA_ORIENTATION=